MDKNQFVSILKGYSDCSKDEAQEVLLLKGLFPYSQMLHALAARVSKDHGLQNQQSELQLAAVYAADRLVLKEIITKDALDYTKVINSKSIQEVAINLKVAASINSTSIPQNKNSIPDEESNELVEELMYDLKRLSELKHNFEDLFMNHSNSKPEQKLTEKVVIEPGHANIDSGMSKKQRIIELARSLQSENDTVRTESATLKKKESPTEKLIEEIKISKKEIEPEDEKHKEQIQIIDQFIKIQPSITQAKERIQQAPTGDLNTIKSGDFGENIVSETLVELLIKQGKKDKAIEVLKKLIWKYPQKKTFFAAQIEDLKK